MRSPSLWMTINPLDYEDPIVQIFAGEKIDMDSFFESMGPNPNQRARNVANDPFASAAFLILSYGQHWRLYWAFMSQINK